MSAPLGPPPPRSHARAWVSTLLLLCYAAFVLLVTMWPSPGSLGVGGLAERILTTLHRAGVPEWFDYDLLEFTANIGMFVPLGFLLGVALGRRSWWLALLLLPAFSGAIELTQGVALAERVSTVQDVLANTLGGYAGLLVAMVLRAMIHARDRRIVEREIWERRAVYARAREQQAAHMARQGRPAQGGQQWPLAQGGGSPTAAHAFDTAPTVRLPRR